MLPFQRNGSTTHEISVVSVRVSGFVPVIVLDISDEFYHRCC